MARIDPSCLYLLLLLQPDLSKAYTPTEATHKKTRAEYLILSPQYLEGYKHHKTSGIVNEIQGTRQKKKFLRLGNLTSLPISLIASEKGTNNPTSPGLLGPFRK